MEITLVKARQLLTVYLECSGPGSRAEKARAWIPQDQQEEAREFWSGRMLINHSKYEEILKIMGVPSRETDLRLAYDLDSRPGYLYEFWFDPNGAYVGSGFVREGSQLPAPETAERPSLPSRLAAIGATAEEVRAWLGPPADAMGWWPVEAWDYGDGLVIEMRHGVVEVG